VADSFNLLECNIYTDAIESRSQYWIDLICIKWIFYNITDRRMETANWNNALSR